MTLRLHSLSLLSLVSLLGACGSSSDDDQTQAEDIAEYDALQASLDGNRSVFDDAGGQNLATSGNVLFWVDASAGDPVLHSFDTSSNARTVYTFPIFMPIGMGSHTDKLNFQASSQAIASMNAADGAQVYRVGSAQSLLGKLTLDAPPFGQKWWSYSVDGGELYVAVQKPDDAKYTLQKWSPGGGAPSDVLVFDDVIAPNPLNELIDFRVVGNLVVFDDHGRYWMVDANGGKAKWVQNDRDVDSLAFASGGVVYNQGLTFYRYDFASDTRENLSDKLAANSYRINKTYATAHLPSAGGVTWSMAGSNTIVYVGNSGLFSYDFAADVVTPILLDPRTGATTVHYIDPVVAGKAVYVTGLESTDGSVGADGPIFTVATP